MKEINEENGGVCVVVENVILRYKLLRMYYIYIINSNNNDNDNNTIRTYLRVL